MLDPSLPTRVEGIAELAAKVGPRVPATISDLIREAMPGSGDPPPRRTPRPRRKEQCHPGTEHGADGQPHDQFGVSLGILR